MICSKCGNQVPEGKTFCSQCGTPVGQQPQQYQQSAGQEAPKFDLAKACSNGWNKVKKFFVDTKQKLDAKGAKPWMYIAAAGALVATVVLIIVLCSGGGVNLKYEWGMSPRDFDRDDNAEECYYLGYIIKDKYHDVDELVDLEIINDSVYYDFDSKMGLYRSGYYAARELSAR